MASKVKAERAEVIKLIPLEMIDRPAVADRLEVPEDGIDELAASIREKTQLVAIQVVERNGRFEIVFGDRRFLACRKLGLKTIKAVVSACDPEEVAVIRATENLQRANLTPVEEARVFKRLYDDHQLDYDKIGKMIGISGGVVKRRMSLLNMDSEVVKAVHAGKISQGVAEELTRCGDESHRLFLLGCAVDHGVTMMVMRQWIEDWKRTTERPPAGVAEGGGPRFPGEPTPIFRACELCKDPVNVSKMVQIECCASCGHAIMKVLRGEGD